MGAQLPPGLPAGSLVPIGLPTTANTTTVNLQSSGNSNVFDAQITSSGGGLPGNNGQGVLRFFAGQHSFTGFDGTEQARVSTVPISVNYVELAGGTTGKGANIFSNGSDVKVDLNLTAKGVGAIAFGNASGSLLNIGDPGALINATATIYPGTSAIPPGIDVPATLAFTINRAIAFEISNPSPAVSPTSFPKIECGTSFPIFTVGGAASNIQLTLSAKGNSLLALTNTGQGNIAYFSGNGLIANRLSVISQAAGQPVRVGPATDSETTAVMYLTAPTAGLIKADQFAFQNIVANQGYDIVVAADAGTHVVAAGKSGIVYNPAGTIASFTETLPASPIDGQECLFRSTQTITAYTLSPNTGQSIAAGAAPSALTSSTPFKMQWIASLLTWVRAA